MKKNILKISLAMLAATALALPALAATTVSFSPAGVSATQGKTFSVSVAVNPQAVNNYTAKIQLNYPADILEVKSFSFGNSWMPLTQSDYDLIDNTNGTLIKTAGYPGGLSSAATFGTISFYAKRAGSGTIKLGSGSLALDANSQNVISGSPEISFNVSSAPAPEKPASGTPAPAPSQSEEITAPAATGQTAEQPASQSLATTNQQISLTAALGVVLTLGTGKMWIGILVGIIILAIAAYVIYLIVTQRRQKRLE